MKYIDHTIGSYLRRNIIFPFYWKYIKHFKVLSCYKTLRNHQWNTLEENKRIQQKKLYKLIEYVSKNIAYYKRIIREYNIQFSEDTILIIVILQVGQQGNRQYFTKTGITLHGTPQLKFSSMNGLGKRLASLW